MYVHIPLANAPKNLDKEGIKYVIRTVCIVLGIMLFLSYLNEILYYTYYKPFYALFKKSLYLPFNLYIWRQFAIEYFQFILFPFFLLIVFVVIEKRLKKRIVLFTGIILLFFLSDGYNISKDIIFKHKDHYITKICSLDTLSESGGGKGIVNYRIYFYNRSDRHLIKYYESRIEMDIYQYRKLELLKKDNDGLLLLVYYLPNTRRMLKYEIINA